MVKTYNGETYIIPKEFEEEVRADERERIIREYEKAVLADKLSMTHGDIFAHNVDNFWKMLKEQK